MALRARDPQGALSALESKLKESRPGFDALLLAGQAWDQLRRPKQAREFARRAVALREHPDALLLLARCHRQAGETDETVRLCDKVLAQNPDHLAAQVIKGGALEEAGRFEEAKAVIRPLFEAGDQQGQMMIGVRYEWAKLLVQDKKFDDAVALLDPLIGDERTPAELRRSQLHLKAKACDRRADYAGAYEAARGANEIGELEFSAALYDEQVTHLIENWSREQMARFPISSCESEIPVFVAGMPRSGTSLIDQIIDAHPKAAGVGELATIEAFAMQLSKGWDAEKEPPESFGAFQSKAWTRTAEGYIRDLKKQAPGAERVVNKALGNNKLVGLLARLFPKTRIIHAIRDPRDVAVSCYMGGFNNHLHPWTTRFDWISHAWAQSQRMMEHWKSSLDVPILDVHYERLVSDPETEFPRIIEFLGLEWDEACNRFYESRRTVRTLSYDQVNRPLYTSSAGRNANYAPWMEGVEFPAYDPWAARA